MSASLPGVRAAFRPPGQVEVLSEFEQDVLRPPAHLSSQHTRSVRSPSSTMPRAAPPRAKKPINDDDLVENYAVESLSDVSADEGVPPVSSSPAATLTLGVKRKRDGKPAAGAAGGALVPDARSRAVAGAGADATSAASAVSARDVVSTFWSAFTASTTGSRLTDEEIACPLKEEHVVVPPKEAVAWPPSVTDVSDIAAIIKASLPKWGAVFGTKTKALSRPAAAPAVIIITTSARRAADMLKPLAVFKTRIAKLFAKHLSVDEQKAILAGPPVTIAVGMFHTHLPRTSAGCARPACGGWGKHVPWLPRRCRAREVT
ncbi:hypothetical protein EON66_02070 [archaeon]|nr:MAG: hypothetical protein EON66_02070 [archaeon]